MSAKSFSKDICIEMMISGNSVEVVATVEFTATPYDPGVSSGPAEQCYPPEGGEIEIQRIAALFYPEVKPIKGPGHHVSGSPQIDLECPDWLAEAIIANVSDDDLQDAIDFDDGPDPDAEYDRRRDRDSYPYESMYGSAGDD